MNIDALLGYNRTNARDARKRVRKTDRLTKFIKEVKRTVKARNRARR